MTGFSGSRNDRTHLPTNRMFKWEQESSKDDGYVSALSNGGHSLQCKDRNGEGGWSVSVSVHSNVQLLDLSARRPSGTHAETPSSSFRYTNLWFGKEVWESLADTHYSKPQYFGEQELWGAPAFTGWEEKEQTRDGTECCG